MPKIKRNSTHTPRHTHAHQLDHSKDMTPQQSQPLLRHAVRRQLQQHQDAASAHQMLSPPTRSFSRCPEWLRRVSCAPAPPPPPTPPVRFGPPNTGCAAAQRPCVSLLRRTLKPDHGKMQSCTLSLHVVASRLGQKTITVNLLAWCMSHYTRCPALPYLNVCTTGGKHTHAAFCAACQKAWHCLLAMGRPRPLAPCSHLHEALVESLPPLPLVAAQPRGRPRFAAALLQAGPVERGLRRGRARPGAAVLTLLPRAPD